MKQPTLKQIIEIANREVNLDDWYRRDQLLVKFKGLSKATLSVYQREMEEMEDFRQGIIKPGHSTTFINVHSFIWYLRWKEANRYKDKKTSPNDVLKNFS